MIRTLEQRHIVYRREQEMADRLEKEGTAVVIAPTSPVPVSRFTKDRQTLTALYESGYQAGKAAVIPF